MHRIRSIASAAVVLTFLALMPLPSSAEPDRSQLKDLTIANLKALYLSCNDGAIDGRLSAGSIARCSTIYEELKERAFEGDFDRFLQWSRSQPADAQARRARHEL